MSIAITSSNFILFSLLGAPQRSILCALFFLIYINNLSNHIISTIKQFTADDILFFIAHNAKTFTGELNSDLQANLNGYPPICCLIQIRIRLKNDNFENGKWQNDFTHKSFSTFITCRKLSEWKIKFILPYLARNFQINA